MPKALDKSKMTLAKKFLQSIAFAILMMKLVA